MNINFTQNYTDNLFSNINSSENLVKDALELKKLMSEHPMFGVIRAKTILQSTFEAIQNDINDKKQTVINENLENNIEIRSCGFIVEGDNDNEAKIVTLTSEKWVKFTKNLVLMANKETNDFTKINRQSNFTNTFKEILEKALLDALKTEEENYENKPLSVLKDLLQIVGQTPKIYSSIVMATLKEKKLKENTEDENDSVANLKDNLGTYALESMFFLAGKPINNDIIQDFMALAQELSFFSEDSIEPITNKKIRATYAFLNNNSIRFKNIFKLKGVWISDLTIKAMCLSLIKYFYKNIKKNPVSAENLPKVSFDIVAAINRFLKSYKMLIGAELVKILQKNNIISLTTKELNDKSKISVYKIVDENVSYGLKETFPSFVFSNEEMEKILCNDPNVETEELINFFLPNITSDAENYYMVGERDPETKKMLDQNFKEKTRYTINRKFALFWYKTIIELEQYRKSRGNLSLLENDPVLLGFLSTIYEIDFAGFAKEFPALLYKNILEDALDFNQIKPCSFKLNYLLETNSSKESENILKNSETNLKNISNKIYSTKVSLTGLIMQVYILNQFTSFFYSWFSSCNGRLNFIGSGVNPQGFSLSKSFLSFATVNDRKLPLEKKGNFKGLNEEIINYLEKVLDKLKTQVNSICKQITPKEIMAELHPRNILKLVFSEHSVVKLSDRFGLYLLAYDIYSLEKNINEIKRQLKETGCFHAVLHEFVTAYNLDAQASGTQMLSITTKDGNLAIYCGLTTNGKNLYNEVIGFISDSFSKMQNLVNSFEENVIDLIEKGLNEKDKTIAIEERKIYKKFQYLSPAEKISYFSEQVSKIKKMNSYIKIKPRIEEILDQIIPIPEYLVKLVGLHNYYRLEKALYLIRIYINNRKIREFFSTKTALKTTILSHAYGSTAIGAKEQILKNFNKHSLKSGILYLEQDYKDLKDLIPTVVSMYFHWNAVNLPSSTALYSTISKLCSEKGKLWDGFDAKENCAISNFYKDPFLVNAHKYSYKIKPFETVMFKAPIKQHVNKNKIYITYRNQINEIDFVKMKNSFVANLVQCWDSNIVTLTVSNRNALFPDLDMPISTNHDCFYTHPMYAPLLKPVVAGAYEEFYKLNLLETVFPRDHHKNFYDIWDKKVSGKKFLPPIKADQLVNTDFIK